MYEIKARLVSGKWVDLHDFKPEDVTAYDIAWALSHLNRYNGHSLAPWSVLSHTGLAFMLAFNDKQDINPVDKMGLLLHDAAETYVGEMIRPIKRTPDMDWYVELEGRLLTVVLKRFGVGWDNVDWPLIERYGKQAAHVEYHWFFPELRGTQDMLPIQYPMGVYPMLIPARVDQFIEVLRGQAINVGTEDINDLFAVPERLTPYLSAPTETASIEGSDQLPGAPDLSAVENLKL